MGGSTHEKYSLVKGLEDCISVTGGGLEQVPDIRSGAGTRRILVPKIPIQPPAFLSLCSHDGSEFILCNNKNPARMEVIACGLATVVEFSLRHEAILENDRPSMPKHLEQGVLRNVFGNRFACGR